MPDIDTAGNHIPKIYRCGSLAYTRRHLAVLFFWLLWGDFCYILMEAVVPSIMPLKFKELGASNTEMGLIMGTIPSIIYSILNPVISFKSDRCRSRFGRRIPFILFSMPFLMLALIGLGFNNQVSHWIHSQIVMFGGHISANTMALGTLGVLLAVFTIFNTFVTSTFWYLFNDVVPEHLLARFISWFRMISMLSGSLYSFLIFRYAGTHSTEIFVGAALLYFIGFGLMCLNVKEGDYPPPPPNLDGKTGPFSEIRTFTKECFSLKHYWFQWLSSFIGSMAGGVMVFALLFSLAIGLDMQQIGFISGTNGICIALLVLGAGWLADRYHPLRVVMAGSLIAMLINMPTSLIWLFWHPAPQVAFWVALTLSIGSTPALAMMAMADPPLLMRLFPRERYGQFCATNAVMRSIGGIIGGGLAGVFLDFMAHWFGKERAYFYIPVWNLCFAIPSFFCLCLLYKSWKRNGGDEGYVPPMIGSITDSPVGYVRLDDSLPPD